MKKNSKCTLITGAASGIGLATAKRFAAEGHALVLVDQNAESLAAAAASMPEGAQVLICAAKVTDPDAVNDCIEQAVARFGGIDGLVTAAGIVKTGSSLEVRRLLSKETTEAISKLHPTASRPSLLLTYRTNRHIAPLNPAHLTPN